MAQAHFVQKARKDNPAVKAGESYYWWKFRYGFKHYSATRPKQSQLTNSPFLSEMYAISEDLADMQSPTDEIEGLLDRIDALREQAENSLYAMPEQLQDGDTGWLLQERIDAMEAWRNDLESIDMEVKEGLSDEKHDDRLIEIFDEISGVEPGCS